jgi:hypothetical protein
MACLAGLTVGAGAGCDAHPRPVPLGEQRLALQGLVGWAVQPVLPFCLPRLGLALLMQTVPVSAGLLENIALHRHFALVSAFQQEVQRLCCILMLWHEPQLHDLASLAAAPGEAAVPLD